MKREIFVIAMLLIGFAVLNINAVIAQDEEIPVPGETEKILDAVNNLPIDEEGNVDETQITGYKSKAELRIEAANKIIGPVTNFLFGAELTLSWHFAFAFMMWIIILAVIAVALNQVLQITSLIAIPIGLIVSTLGMRIFGKQTIGLVDSLLLTWWASAIAIVVAIVSIVLYSVIMAYIGKVIKEKEKKETEERREQKASTLEKIEDIKLKGAGYQ